MSKTARFLIVLIVILLLGAAVVYKLQARSFLASIGQASNNLTVERKKWNKLIDLVGPKEAFMKLKGEFKEQFNSAHEAAHRFGEVLYQKDGLDAITICDETFDYACYHGVIFSAIQDKGVAIIRKLNQVCLERFGPDKPGCQHGIGHGILEYLGLDKLVEALNLCSQLSWHGRLFGCQGGVMMQYNFPVSLRKDYTGQRRVADDNPYVPCLTLPPRYNEVCFLELTRLWYKAYNRDFAKMGKLCQKIIKKEGQETCFWGIGLNAGVNTGFDTLKNRQICTLMPDTQSEILCRAGSYLGYVHTNHKATREDFCQDLSATNTKTCYAKIEEFRKRTQN